MSTKWHQYYANKTGAPWDSGKPASQLQAFISSDSFVQCCKSVGPNGLPPLAVSHQQPSNGDTQAAEEKARSPRALEFGCGTGGSCLYLAQQGFHCTGVDIVESAIDAANEKKKEFLTDTESMRCDFIVRDAWELSGDDNMNAQFDFVFDCQTFHVLRQKDEQGIVKIFHKLLRPGGVIMVMTGNSKEPECGPSVLTESDIRAAFPGDAGWECVSLQESRFDMTDTYAALDKCPLAWVGVFRKTTK